MEVSRSPGLCLSLHHGSSSFLLPGRGRAARSEYSPRLHSEPWKEWAGVRAPGPWRADLTGSASGFRHKMVAPAATLNSLATFPPLRPRPRRSPRIEGHPQVGQVAGQATVGKGLPGRWRRVGDAVGGMEPPRWWCCWPQVEVRGQEQAGHQGERATAAGRWRTGARWNAARAPRAGRAEARPAREGRATRTQSCLRQGQRCRGRQFGRRVRGLKGSLGGCWSSPPRAPGNPPCQYRPRSTASCSSR